MEPNSPQQKTTDEPSCNESSFSDLLQTWDKDLTDEYIQKWEDTDCNEPGHQLYTDEEIISQVMRSEE